MLGAISVGAWAMIFMTALTQGMVTEMIRDGISALPGHVQIHHPDFGDDPNITNLVPQPDSEIVETFDEAGFIGWSSRVKVPAVITSERESRGVTLLGVDPDRERGMTFVNYDEVEGRFLESIDDRGVVIGRKLANTLDTEVGKRIVLMSQDPDNDVADRGFRVVGLFSANVEAFEEAYVFAGKQTIQKMLGVGDHVTEIVVLADNYRNVEDEFERARELAGDGVKVQRWYEVDTYLGTMLSVMDGFVMVWVIVIFLALSFGLVNTLVMAVFERVREIGLMLALGMKTGQHTRPDPDRVDAVADHRPDNRQPARLVDDQAAGEWHRYLHRRGRHGDDGRLQHVVPRAQDSGRRIGERRRSRARFPRKPLAGLARIALRAD